MAHKAASPAKQGVILKPHFLDPSETPTALYCHSVLQTDVFPQVASLLEEGEKWRFQQDLASPRAAKVTKSFIADQGVELLPWLPCGADVSALDIFVNPELKKKLRGKDMSARQKLIEATARALAEMSTDPVFLDRPNRCCRSAKRRSRWAAARGGKLSAIDLVNKWAACAAEAENGE